MASSFSYIQLIPTFMIILLISPSRSSRTLPTTSASVPQEAILANRSSLFSTPHTGEIFEFTRVKDFQPTAFEILKQDNLRMKWLAASFEYAQQNYNRSHGDGLTGGSNIVVPQMDGEINYDYMWGLVYSGYSVGNSHQIVRLEVGTPPQTLELLFDTGSDLTWVFCPKCLMCGQEYGPAFEPSTSSSIKPIMCDDPMCHAVQNPRCKTDRACLYEQFYGLGHSKTQGYLAKEKLTFAFISVETAIGCSDLESIGSGYNGVSGILGMGQGVISMTKQLQLKSFAYCITTPGSDTKAMLSFNQEIPTSSDYISVGILQNRRYKSWYYLNIWGISLDEEQLDIPAYIFQIDRRTGTGGIIIDSGSVITNIPSEAYVILRDAIRQMIPHPLVDSHKDTESDKELDTCYNQDTMEAFKLPSLAFNLPSDDLLYVRNYFMPIPEHNKSCLAVLGDDSPPMSIIGSFILQGIRMAYDLENRQVVFYPGNQCLLYSSSN